MKFKREDNKRSIEKSKNLKGQKTQNQENSLEKKKSKGGNKKTEERESSDREDSIINKVENFDADD